MSKKIVLLPKMAVTNIHKNGSTYFPYIGVSVFAMFTYFVFDLILNNEIMQTLPRAGYAMILVQIGFWLLGIIMVPFLYYTNSFLIKRRKKELGLYSILGLEKKHIGMMMLLESLGIYVIVMAAAIGIGLLFSKLIFLCLLNLAGLPVDAVFAIKPKAITDTMIFYAFISLLNLCVNLFQVGKSNPVEMMGDSKKGEKEPKHILLWSIVGILFLGLGYYMAITAKMNSMIFIAFFFAVFLVVIGTYYLFTAGSIALLRSMKKNKKLYYRPDNFITVSGMLYRMKKNAASLSNICVFATMVIVTAVCTISLYLGMDSITSFVYPKTFDARFSGAQRVTREELTAGIEEIAQKSGVELKDFLAYEYCKISITQEGNCFRKSEQGDGLDKKYGVRLMTLAEYNRLAEDDEELTASQVIVYSTGRDFGYDTLLLGDEQLQVKRELSSFPVSKKEAKDIYNVYYVLVVPDVEKLAQEAAKFDVDAAAESVLLCEFNADGESTQLDEMYELLYQYASGLPGYEHAIDYRPDMEDMQSMYGGLLFIGIFFGLIFLICLLVIMYYKQITEGYEDQKNFEIMQKVGMSDEEIRHTIKKQILLVFSLPILGAVCHTIVAMKMVILLMGVIWMYQTGVIIACAVVVTLVFGVLYSFCYKCTAGTYYRIVKQMNAS